jgi:hypothetical protein
LQRLPMRSTRCWRGYLKGNRRLGPYCLIPCRDRSSTRCHVEPWQAPVARESAISALGLIADDVRNALPARFGSKADMSASVAKDSTAAPCHCQDPAYES